MGTRLTDRRETDHLRVDLKTKTRSLWTLAPITTLCLLHWAILYYHVPIFTAWPGWHHRFCHKPLGSWWLVILLCITPLFTLWLIRQRRLNHWLVLIALICIGYGLQMGFAYTEGRSINGIRDRMVMSGHAQFADFAVSHRNVEVFTRYEELAKQGRLGQYLVSKPPGQLLIYMLTEKLANWRNPKASYNHRLEGLRDFASLIWPLFSYLVLIPLFLFCRYLLDIERGLIAGAFYLFIPSINLITLHTDQFFYPLVVMTGLLFGTVAFRTRRLVFATAMGFIAGISLYFIVFFSFALVLTLPMIAVMAVAFFRWDEPLVSAKRLVVVGSALLIGIVLVDLVMRTTLNYDFVQRYQTAIAYHAKWQGWQPTMQGWLRASIMISVEYALWLGLPLLWLFVGSVRRAVREVLLGQHSVPQMLCIALLVVFVLLYLFGRTIAEVARLWIFLMPPICIVAAHQLTRVWTDRRYKVLFIVLLLQFVTVYFTKRFQDFW